MSFKIKKWNVYTADLNPAHKAEPGKIRPVIAIQTDLLNNIHPTTIICPITTNIIPKVTQLRVHLKKGESGLKESSDILVDQIRAIDNSRFLKHLGQINDETIQILENRIKNILD